MREATSTSGMRLCCVCIRVRMSSFSEKIERLINWRADSCPSSFREDIVSSISCSRRNPFALVTRTAQAQQGASE